MDLKSALATLALCATLLTAQAEDRRERQWFTPALPPTHKAKPPVTGWAGTRVEEPLGRGLFAAPNREGKVYLGWRLLQGEGGDVAFNVYRSAKGGAAVRLNKEPVGRTTDFIDATPRGGDCEYWVRPVAGGKELAPSERVAVKQEDQATTAAYRAIKFQGEYTIAKAGVGDLDGDGAYDFVIKQPGSSIDPAGRPNTDGTTYKLEAYRSDGTFLWRHDLGPGIEPGIWYSPYVVRDLDGDGKAEVAVKAGPADARESDGRVRQGPEWIAILDGMTGREKAHADWPARDERYGDYNRNNRNQIGVAYLDGKTPCVLAARGTYKLMVVDAYQYHGGRLERVWHWEGDDETPVIRSQGSHNMHAADVDGDGRDEVILGSVCLDDNGTALWSSGLGHPDKTYVTDIDPARPGMEFFEVLEPDLKEGTGVIMLDAKTGKTIWRIGKPTYHVGDAMAADIDPSVPGLECWGTEDPKGGSRDKYMFSAAGKPLGTADDAPACRNWAFWDADLLRETIAGGGFARTPRPARGDRMTSATAPRRFGRGGLGGFRRAPSAVVKYKGEALTPGIEGSVVMIADLMGDWREEIVTALPGELRVYTTTIPAADRRTCLMQDPVYRADVTMRSQGYDQSPVTGYYLGVDPKDAGKYKAVIEGKDGQVVQSRDGFQE